MTMLNIIGIVEWVNQHENGL